ncbi:hypothetical protein LEMLEM_LOCUS7120 [Lemmus lemmus]
MRFEILILSAPPILTLTDLMEH